jgi:hypothetical protein
MTKTMMLAFGVGFFALSAAGCAGETSNGDDDEGTVGTARQAVLTGDPPCSVSAAKPIGSCNYAYCTFWGKLSYSCPVAPGQSTAATLRLQTNETGSAWVTKVSENKNIYATNIPLSGTLATNNGYSYPSPLACWQIRTSVTVAGVTETRDMCN